MTRTENLIDKTFDELRTRGAGCSKSFTNDLENRIMKEWKNPVSRNRRAIWTAVIATLVMGVAGGAYAGSDLIREWMYGPFYLEADGTVINTDGDMVGTTEWHSDGTAVTTILGEGGMVVIDSSDQTEGAFSVPLQPIVESDAQASKAPESDNHE